MSAWLHPQEQAEEVGSADRSCDEAGRLGHPGDVVNLAAFLTSTDAAWITGTTIMLDGGLSAGNPTMATDILSEN